LKTLQSLDKAAGKPPPPKKNVDKEARIAAGICSYCGVNPLSTGTLCRTCADRYNARTRRYHAALAAARAKLVTPHP
jgi:hypothetical protein